MAGFVGIQFGVEAPIDAMFFRLGDNPRCAPPSASETRFLEPTHCLVGPEPGHPTAPRTLNNGSKRLSALLYQAIQGAEPISSIRGYRRTENRLRHYERLGSGLGRLRAKARKPSSSVGG